MPERVVLARPLCIPKASRFHASEAFLDDATNIRTGTKYLQMLIDRQRAKGVRNPVVEAYKKYRGLSNGVYYEKISRAAEQLAADPESVQVLREMVK